MGLARGCTIESVLRRIVLFCFLLIIAGCGPSVAGRYVGMRKVRPGPAHVVGTAAKVELVLESDGRFRLLNLSLSSDGYWRVENGRVVLETTHVLGRPASDKSGPYATVRGDQLEFTDPRVDDEPVVLTRAR